MNVLSQFTDKGSEGTPRETLSTYIPVPEVYPAGRLDRDSEGLLILTDNGRLQARISNPRHKLLKTYIVQVEGEATQALLEQIRRGLTLKDGPTLPAMVEQIAQPDLWPRDPPVRYRKSVPESWLRLSIREGRNRQVRRMTAHVGLPCLRLVRWAIGDWTVEGLRPGEWREV
ncbi:unnamed protein product [Cyprideis torosa]|uniref:Pseudouridine synthase RsuA/RluA-like domain-containing protein n=1 Tax=Cyprideis torosa TaxID=163714 RepID=A0A7R8WYB4_9CRUS|nr:unnamed protein product [Cyprideis torosa]CAG0908498.1 unnamed protein product [Cyprideis torosa]